MRPATVEELAAAERAEAALPTVRQRVKRPLVIAGTTASLLLAGASAVALARAGSDPVMVPPNGEAAPFGVGYHDGFGEHSPKPTEKPSSKRSVSSKSATPAVTPPSDPIIVIAPGSASPSGQTIGGGTEAPQNNLAAVYWVAAFRDSYDIFVWVHNSGPTEVDWKLRVELPANTTISTAWAANKTSEPGNAWVFTSSRGTKLSPGRTYLFAFEGRRPSGSFALRACSVNGVACTRYGTSA